MADESFRLPASSYDILRTIIQAYAAIDGAASLDDVSQRAALNSTMISRNNRFLTSIGVIEGGSQKQITSVGRDLARALEYGMSDDIRRIWNELATANEFMDKILSAIRIRHGMERSNLQAHIAYTAGQSRSPAVMTGASTIVDILLAAGLAREDDGKIVAISTSEATPSEPAEDSVKERPGIDAQVPNVLGERVSIRSGSNSEPAINLTIELHVSCTPDDLESIGPKIRALIDDVVQGPEVRRGDSGVDKDQG